MQWYLKVGVLGGVYIMNAINALIEKKKKKTELPQPFCHLKIQQKDGCVWPRKQAGNLTLNFPPVGYKLLSPNHDVSP